MARHNGKESCKCNICDFYFSSAGNMRLHKKKIHEREELKFKCDLCNFSTDLKRGLSIHIIRSHNDIQRFIPNSDCTKKH